MSAEEVTPPSGAPEEAPVQRNFSGWIFLALVFLLLVGNALVGALQPSDRKANPYSTQELQFRLLVSQKRLQDEFASRTPNAKDAKEQVNESLGEMVSAVVGPAKKDPAAARLYAALRTEQGREVSKEALATLQGSRASIDRTFTEIYSTPKLAPDRAKALAGALPKEGFVNQIAAIHALEKAGDKEAREDRISYWPAARTAVGIMLGCGLGVLSLVVWMAYFAGRNSGRFAPKGHPVGRVSLHDADRLAIRAAQILGAFIALQFLLPGLRLGMATNVALGMGILGVVVLLSQVPVDGQRITLASIGVSSQNLGKNVMWGIAGFVAELSVTIPLALIGNALFSFLPSPSHPATEEIQRSGQLLSVLPILLFGAIIAPIWEEILFRGLLFPAIGRLMASVLGGAIASSLLFGLIHPQGPALVLALAGVGAVSCGLAYQTRSLVPSIVMHMLHNSATFTLLFLMM